MHATTEHIIYTHSTEEIIQIKNDLERALNTIPKYKFPLQDNNCEPPRTDLEKNKKT